MEKRITRRLAIKTLAVGCSGLTGCTAGGRLFGDDSPAAPGEACSTGRASTDCATPLLEPHSYALTDTTVVVDLGKAACLSRAGRAARLDVEDRDLHFIVVRLDDRKFACLRNRCTHAGRTMSYVQARGLLSCTNYNHSLFELDGTVFKGPAAEPLTSYETRLLDGDALEIRI